MNIQVLGSACAKCKVTQQLIEEVAAQMGVTIKVEKVEDMQKIIAFGVMATPGVVVDGKVVHSGSVPKREAVMAWLNQSSAAASGCCGDKASTTSDSKSGSCCDESSDCCEDPSECCPPGSDACETKPKGGCCG